MITEDFVKTYNEFTEYCDKNSINASSAIRKAIRDWLKEKKGEGDRLKKSKKSSYWKRGGSG
ncbi:MAG: hypothetical protein R6W73_01555 [Candidatus Saliniplasma sp.]